MNRLSLTVVGLIFVGLAGFWLWSANGPTGDAPTRTSGTALVGGPFTLVTHKGETVTNATFAGQYMLVFFGFTFCPDVCPTELQVMSSALDLLSAQDGAKAAQVQPLFVSIDPERDTPEKMADYVSYFHPRLIGLTGSPEQVAGAAKAYRVYYQRAENEGSDNGGSTGDTSQGDYLMDHSAVVYLMGPDGAFISHFAPGTSPEAMARKISDTISG